MSYLSIPIFNRKLIIQVGYKPKNCIIPIGCDCHPAYFIKALGARKSSLPFDWINTAPLIALSYVSKNILNNFEFFVDSLERNKAGRVVSSYYEFSELTHFPKTVFGERSVAKMRKRIKIFSSLIKGTKCNFLHVIPASALQTEERVKGLLTSILQFKSIIKQEDTLHIYIRYDNDFKENYHFSKILLEEISNINNVVAAEFVRDISRFGIWGNEEDFPALFKSLQLGSETRVILRLMRKS